MPVTVVGVAARRFAGIEVATRTDLWLPTAIETMIEQPSQRQSGRMFLAVMARLKPGVTIEQATAEMRVLDRSRVEDMSRIFNNNPQWLKARLDVEPAGAGTSVLRENLSRPLLALMAMVAVLLLLACVNIASLLLARGAAREREMALARGCWREPPAPVASGLRRIAAAVRRRRAHRHRARLCGRDARSCKSCSRVVR